MWKMSEERKANTERLFSYFWRELGKVGRDGVLGVASFADVFGELMPVQRNKLKELCGRSFQDMLSGGSIVSIGISHSENAIDSINVVVNGIIDKKRWNEYGREYEKINQSLDEIAGKIADSFGGTPIAATIGGLVGKVSNVEEYYALTISHRIVAECAGLGWRGKNELVVNERYGCALRFASIVMDTKFQNGNKMKSKCGHCSACLDACSILKNKDKLKNYRENCRRFIESLGLEHEVCGKCIAACYRKSIYKDIFRLKRI